MQEAAQGDTVTLTATPDEGYKLKEWQVVSGGVYVAADNTFTMENEDVTVKPVFAKVYKTNITDFTVSGTVGQKITPVQLHLIINTASNTWPIMRPGYNYTNTFKRTVTNLPAGLMVTVVSTSDDGRVLNLEISGVPLAEVSAAAVLGNENYDPSAQCRFEIEPHVHSPAEEWLSDKDNHWNNCVLDDGEKMNLSAHTPGEWIIDSQPTETAEGSKHRACTVCGYVAVTEAIAKLAPSPTAAPTAAPTATPTAVPTAFPTSAPTASPTAAPSTSPKTGDESNVLLLAVDFVVSALGAGSVIYKKKKS